MRITEMTFLADWGMTRREFLLKLGTESLRNNFHTDTHVISAFSDYT
jgi:outer membrane protein assembly factor BamE (lipoprotein component of BamABCDE complex)